MYEHEKDNPKYNAFVDKFRPESRKKNTDDCTQELKIYPGECCYISNLDEMRQKKKSLFGGGLLINDNAAERVKKAKDNCPSSEIEWHLSEREKQLAEELNKQSE